MPMRPIWTLFRKTQKQRHYDRSLKPESAIRGISAFEGVDLEKFRVTKKELFNIGHGALGERAENAARMLINNYKEGGLKYAERYWVNSIEPVVEHPLSAFGAEYGDKVAGPLHKLMGVLKLHTQVQNEIARAEGSKKPNKAVLDELGKKEKIIAAIIKSVID